MMMIQWMFLVITPVLSSKILYIAPIHASSHAMWNTFLATGLAERGHEITYITPANNKMENSSHSNIRLQIYQQSQHLIEWREKIILSLTDKRTDVFTSIRKKQIYECEEMFEKGPYKALINSPDHFDLIILEYVGHDCLLGLSHTFQSTPIILVAAYPHMPLWSHRILGSPVFHMFPHFTQPMSPPYDFRKRVTSLINYVLGDFEYFLQSQPEMDEIIRKKFGQEVLPLKEIWKKVALMLTNTPVWMNKIPVPPNFIAVGGIHLKEAEQLNKELLEIMDRAEHGVILISFGTSFPLEAKLAKFRILASAVARLRQRILWKWDQKDDYNITFPKNVVRKAWLPQNDLLGHPNLRLFVSHCGGQSSLEAMYHGVPVLAVPGFWDQSENANAIVDQKAGLRLDFDELTEESFLQTARELISNSSYREWALKLKSIIRDEPMKPLDRAIFWIEFVIRHKGAPHLRPLLWDLPHPYTLLFDVAIVIITMTLFILAVAACLMYFICVAKNTLCSQVLLKYKTE